GTLDFQVYFRLFDPALLPGGGALNIEVRDLNGNIIGSSVGGPAQFGAQGSTGNARVRIPVVAGQSYFLHVFGVGGSSTGGSGSMLSGDLFYTRFGAGTSPNVNRVHFAYDGTTFTLSTPSAVSTVPQADGLVFTSDGFLAVGGAGSVFKVNPNNGSFISQPTGGTEADHMMVAPDGTIFSS